MLIAFISTVLLVSFCYAFIKIKLSKRAWRPVKVEGLTKVKQHTVGPLELLAESSLLIEYTFKGEKYSCQTAYTESLYNSFLSKKATYIYIDPDNPTQCLHNAQTKWRYAKLWLFLALIVATCLVLKELI
ncbi:hypothetical protein HG263_01670 [Pseudoalteromonas sp. JBTF-M23]|uniref:DUF3592 domain-containing protein n=1 Tax=Pseudoalteromonas caenipelagi TaxID=2726988 RepID=A0A849VC33_9GAMM|nr:hypothetical protein [Pseudoalteromonas caenipelagi]NOU49261.1 hypothetical protein [Pseudoalteromonas caenipelagi]